MKKLLAISTLIITLSSGSAFAFGQQAASVIPANDKEATTRIIEVGMGVKNRSGGFRASQFSQTQGSQSSQSACLLCTGLGLGTGNLLNLNLGIASRSSTTTSYSQHQGTRISRR
jgi:hypothetical protein